MAINLPLMSARRTLGIAMLVLALVISAASFFLEDCILAGWAIVLCLFANLFYGQPGKANSE